MRRGSEIHNRITVYRTQMQVNQLAVSITRIVCRRSARCMIYIGCKVAYVYPDAQKAGRFRRDINELVTPDNARASHASPHSIHKFTGGFGVVSFPRRKSLERESHGRTVRGDCY